MTQNDSATATIEKTYNPKDNTYSYSLNTTASVAIPTDGYIDEYAIFLGFKEGIISALNNTHTYKIEEKGSTPKDTQ